MAMAVFLAESRRAEAEFQRTADLAVDRVVTRLRQHVVVLRAAQGFFAASSGKVTRDEFRRFLQSVDIETALAGVRGIGFARMVAAAGTAGPEAEIALSYGLDVAVRPETEMGWRTPIVLIEPADARNLAALGFDMYSEPTRRSAMDRAIISGEPQMTGPVELVQETAADKQQGFLVYLPLSVQPPAGADQPPVDAFVYAPFRAGDLVKAAMQAGPPLPVVFGIRDTGATGLMLYDGLGAASDSSLRLDRTVEVYGRQWGFELRETRGGPALQRHLASLLVGLTSILLAVAASFAIHARQEETAQARAAASAAAREAEDRGLLLQEMKHRIKNHIARIQAIARQSARGATDLRDFTDSFDARLQAMAAAQEVLVGSALPQAEVAAILREELRQGLDGPEVEAMLVGPDVRLNERQAHAFALVVHELLTNAMKYGGLSPSGEGLRIAWATEPGEDGRPAVLTVTWVERFSQPSADSKPGPGFGTRLIEASLRGELAGQMTRGLGPDGLTVALRVPLDPALAGPRAAPGRRGKPLRGAKA